jgi:hypothetical protein
MEILREELYRRVWERPVAVLAKEYEISDVDLVNRWFSFSENM